MLLRSVVRVLKQRIGKRIAAANDGRTKLDIRRHSIPKVAINTTDKYHIGFAWWRHCDGVFRFLSGTGIDREYDTGTANNNKINTIPYEPRQRDAEDSDGNGVTDTVKSCSQSQAETFKIAFFHVFQRSADKWILARIGSKKHAGSSSHLAEAILSDSVRRHE